jgi:acetoacetyl-CoA synthetase
MQPQYASEPLWTPTQSQIQASPLQQFKAHIGQPDISYTELHRWSVDHAGEFWQAVWDFTEIVGTVDGVDRDSTFNRAGGDVIDHPGQMPGASFFNNARLNFAENLLRHRGPQVAVISRLENGERTTLSRDALFQQVASLAHALRSMGVVPGDRVAAFLPNISETLTVMLATTSLGAVFTSCSPDFGINGVFDRFSQTTPRVLFTCNGYHYNGKRIDNRDTVLALGERIETIEQIVMVPVLDAQEYPIPDPCQSYPHLLDTHATDDLTFTPMGFNDPLYIMYSSGTTGTPKCIVHGIGGTLLQHVKEHRLHTGLQPGEKFFYFTTCGWMMWNWLMSGLASGATLVLFDGSPTYPAADSLWQMAEEEGIAVFGTSARYLSSIEKLSIIPAQTYQLPQLRMVLSTGSPLSVESFRYVYHKIKADVCLASISGGTDILSCFALGNPCLPVFAGELQCMGLGMDVDVFNDQGQPIRERKGELVCASPFPSMPTGFWQDDNGDKYRAAYFERFPGIWCQGDYAEITINNGIIIHGRSDAILNPGGVRIGTAEIYRQVEKVDAVVDSICIGQNWQDDVRVVLFVVLRPGAVLDDTLVMKIRGVIRAETTARHVPAIILPVDDIPRTISGKITELAVRNIVHHQPVTNTDALANPAALEFFRDRPELEI